MLSGKIQETYGVTKEEAEKQVSTWEQSQKETTFETKPNVKQ